MNATPPPFSATNARTCCQTLRGTKSWVDVAEDEHVVLEELVAAHGQASQRGFILLGVFGVGILQVGGELNRGIAFQQRFQKTKLVVWIALHHEDANFFIANGDLALLAIVLFVRFVVARRDLDDIRHFAGRQSDGRLGGR